MKQTRHIIRNILLFEVFIGNDGYDVNLWDISFNKGKVHVEKKGFRKGDSLEKWKHNLAILSISGEQVVSKLCRKDDGAIKKVMDNEELLWSVTPSEAQDEVILSFLRKESLREFMELLEKNNMYVLDKWIGKSGTFDKESYITRFYEKEMSFSAITKTPGRMNMVCNTLYFKLRLPVLLLFFCILLANYFVNTRFRKEYEAVQTELNTKQRTDKARQENQKKQGRIQAEYQKIPSCSFALIADRIASYVPPSVQLRLLSVFPLDGTGQSIVNRDKGLKLKSGTILIRGEVEIPGSLTLFSQFLSSDEMFSKVEILSLSRQKDSPMFHFELSVTI